MKNEGIVKELLRQGMLRLPAVKDAFMAIDRADFVPEAARSEARKNIPVSVGDEQMASQPYTVAFMLELLEPKAGEKILEIGTGTGWQAGLLARIVGSGTSESAQRGKVIALELLESLAERATKNLETYHFISEGTVEVIKSDAIRGAESEAPFDKIIASVASNKIPVAWKEQVRIGGRIVAPVGENIVVLDKTGPNAFTRRQYFGFDFAPIAENK